MPYSGVGRTGWHIDGSFQARPFSHSIYHMVEAPRRGATVFCNLTQVNKDIRRLIAPMQVVERLGPERRDFWERLWMCSDRRTGPRHPLIYRCLFSCVLCLIVLADTLTLDFQCCAFILVRYFYLIHGIFT